MQIYLVLDIEYNKLMWILMWQGKKKRVGRNVNVPGATQALLELLGIGANQRIFLKFIVLS